MIRHSEAVGGEFRHVRILTVSDTVERKLYSSKAAERFQGIDLILSCGDVPFYYLEFLVSTFNVPLYYVYGNHHASPMLTGSGEEIKSPGGCIDLDNRLIAFQGTLILGFEGCMRYNDGQKQYTEFEMRRKVFRMAPRLWLNKLTRRRAVDIVITHAPPSGIHDKPDRCHQGFEAFLRLIDTHHPRYFIHGHTHRYTLRDEWKTERGGTTVINTCGYRIIDIESQPR